ncbi:MAG TPA: tetratricopeptide repeat protein [Vicinamibacterales bacterium]|nr:tetratricopeptide repeat protein [Vicinamibacterales bacterium]
MDRAATLRQAETLLHQGKLEPAIAEYRRLADDQPRDWNIANLLGDLYVRAGHIDHGIEQYSRMAEGLSREGFFSKASAVYKKVLKLRPDSDVALTRAAELAAAQGLLADARALFAAAAGGRRQRGDLRGALEIVVRVGDLDPADVPARMAGAQARLDLEDSPAALREYWQIASMLIEQDREQVALEPLRRIVDLDPASGSARRELARILVGHGHVDDASTLLVIDATGADAELVMLVAATRLRQGESGLGLELLERLLAIVPSAGPAVVDLGLALTECGGDVAFLVIDTVAGSQIERREWADAAATLRRFLAMVPAHGAALARLVEIESIVASERQGWSSTAESPADSPHTIDLDLVFGMPPAGPAVSAMHERPVVVGDGTAAGVPVTPPLSQAADDSADIEAVFTRLRNEVSNRPIDEASDAAFTRGVALFEAGELESSVEQLRLATRAPHRRFAASSLLARIYQQLQRTGEARDWLDRALDAPGLSDLERFDTLFRLADLLETSGEPERALAVCLELQAAAGDYRDLPARIDRLSRTQGGG